MEIAEFYLRSLLFLEHCSTNHYVSFFIDLLVIFFSTAGSNSAICSTFALDVGPENNSEVWMNGLKRAEMQAHGNVARCKWQVLSAAQSSYYSKTSRVLVMSSQTCMYIHIPKYPRCSQHTHSTEKFIYYILDFNFWCAFAYAVHTSIRTSCNN